MADAIKVQMTVGDITQFDCRGGEPVDTHMTLYEIDPATNEDIALAEQLQGLLSQLGDRLKAAGIWREARLQVRLMDGDGRK